MEHKAVQKKWDSWISKSLANLQGSFGSKSFLYFNVDYSSDVRKHTGDTIHN